MGKQENDAMVGCSSKTSQLVKSSRTVKGIDQKLRVLCLHGYRQNGETFRNKLGSFRKQVSKYAEFIFITAPHKTATLNDDGVPGQHSWWFNKEDFTFKGTNVDGPAYGFEQSIHFIENVWKEQGPFQGLLGFSQGACLVGLICGLSERKITSIRPDFAVIAAGFKSGSLTHNSAYEDKIHIPTLHIYGTTDEIIPQNMSQKLTEHFEMVEVMTHNGGHYFPASATTKNFFIHFFQDRLVEYLEKEEVNNSTNGAFLYQQAEDSD